MPSLSLPLDRAGLGLRVPHHQDALECRPKIGWFEVHTENYLGGGAWIRDLENIRADYPVAFHCVGLSLGSAAAVDPIHLNRIRALSERLEPAAISDHLSWSVVDGTYLNDLLPLPYTAEALAHFQRNVEIVQDALKRLILIENPSLYVAMPGEMTEPEFFGELVRSTGCLILLDLNNLHVCRENIGRDAEAYLSALPRDAVAEIHLAGHAATHLDKGEPVLIDDHGSAVPTPVWSLYEAAIRRFGRVPTLIERDNNLPPLAALVAEAAEADRIATSAFAGGRDADAA